MARFDAITEAQYVLTIQGISTLWTKCSGIKEAAGVSDYNDGLNATKIKIVGSRELSPITFESAFDPIKHKPVVDLWANYACQPLTATITPVKCGNSAEPIGPSITIYGFKLSKLEFGTADRTGSAPSMIMLEGVAEGWNYA